ncbi:putative transcription factor bHLH family [Rosa chinensis]|uniref:Putative transcription factor bHLH family n=1 Tax=Rosa chinensis TaxID=74649 RepID=A0A2P6PYU9_ROSCH|nr:transcription factor bHLH110 isoform X1 [Rosa chinensis]XP_040363556.1 transcription factor bHLH110 isoform X1 [Rosa chinensis]PRQ27089.1 putative transcription factor bHLH family [Rosa chinensis]
MESANLHHQHHQLQENLGHLGSSSSSSLATAPSYYGVGIKHAWTQPTTTTTNTTNLSNPSNSSFNSSSSINMVPDLGFHCWPPSISNNLNRAGSSSSIKEELSSSSSDSTFPKFTQMLTSPSTTSINLDDDDYHFPTPTSLGLIKNEQKEMMMNDLSEKLLLKTLSSSGINHQISLAGDYHHHHHQQFYSSNNTHVQNFTQLMPGRSGGQYFSQIYPSINISNLNQQSSPSSAISSCGSSDMSLQAIDLLASSRFSAHEPSNSHDTLGIYNKEIRHNSFGLQQMHQSRTNHHDHSLLSCGTNSKISSFENEITEVKRPGSLIEPKATQAAAPKKSRLESRTPCPPLKVRKEKLGDRIATLQQLVAPFGKTDTASVLMEAIGYIKFLQNQVETLSVPYMKSSSRNNKPSKAMLQRGVIEINGSNGDHERKRDLRSRGLCLVPLSCMSYVTAGTDAANATAGVSGSVNWPSPNYGHGGT